LFLEAYAETCAETWAVLETKAFFFLSDIAEAVKRLVEFRPENTIFYDPLFALTTIFSPLSS